MDEREKAARRQTIRDIKKLLRDGSFFASTVAGRSEAIKRRLEAAGMGVQDLGKNTRARFIKFRQQASSPHM